MSGKALSIKNDSKINYLAREISNFIHRGSATTEKLSATLHLIKEETGLKTLKNLKQSHIDAVIAKIASTEASLSSKNSYISSINNIVKYSSKENLHSIKASDYGLSRKINEKDGINKENTREAAVAFTTWLNEKYAEKGDLRYGALAQAVNIQSSNLRLRESLLVKLKSKDFSNDTLKIKGKSDGAKNSREREIKLNIEQKQSLTEARQFLKDNNLKDLCVGTVKQGRDFANNTLKMFRKETNIAFHYHGERHWTAHEVYKNAWSAKGYDVECRARTGEEKQDWQNRIMTKTGLSKSEFKAYDKEIRQEISRDLGHERIEITNRYLG
jgi:hypothetical protein